MLQLSNVLKPALGLALVGLMTVGASADSCPTADSLGLTGQQRQQIYQMTQGGNLGNPAVQQQVMSVLTPAQQYQLQQWGQSQAGGQGGQRHRRHRQNQNQCSNPVGNAQIYNQQPVYQQPVYQQPVYQGGQCPTNPAYYPNQGQVYNNQAYYPNQGQVYNNQAYYPNQGYYNNQGYNNNQGLNMGVNILSGLLNSGMLNGIFSGR